MLNNTIATLPELNFTPIKHYSAIITGLNIQFKLGLNINDICEINESLHNHAGPIHPTTLDMWFDGCNLQQNFAKSIQCLAYTLKNLGYTLKSSIDPERVLCLFGSGHNSGKKYEATTLDLNARHEFSPDELLPTVRSWPGLAALWLLILNPKFCIKLDIDKVPGLFIPGLEIVYGKIMFVHTIDKTVWITERPKSFEYQDVFVPEWFGINNQQRDLS